MVVIAGPPGGGKTSRFPLARFGGDSFNADNRAAQLNAGSFHGISKEIRSQVNLEFQRWILDHISAGKSFAIETTLRSDITFEQAMLAREHGFETSMHYVTTGDVEVSLQRIKARAYGGGHSASEGLVRDIYEKSTRNLAIALNYKISGIDRVDVYDNSTDLAVQTDVKPLLSYRDGHPTYLTDHVPEWLEDVLLQAGSHVGAVREALEPSRFLEPKSRHDVDSRSERDQDPDRDTFDFDR